MKKIVFIDDNPDVRESTKELLEIVGFEVYVADSGKSGVEIVRKEMPDLVICDISMPDLDGYGVLRILGKDPDTFGIPFIFLTAKSDMEDIRKGMNQGADDYISKPFTETELIESIETRIRRAESLKQSLKGGVEGWTELVARAGGLKELGTLVEKRKKKSYNKKETIFREDDYANYLYMVVKGKIKCLKTDNYGKEFVSEIYGEGSFIGYMSLFDNGNYQKTAVAMEPTEVIMIPKQDFLLLVRRNRDVAVNFIKMLSNNVKDMEERMLQLAYASLRERLAVALLKLSNGVKHDEVNSRIKISREDLASIVGTAKESLIRTLSELRRDGMVNTDGQEIILLDKPGLQRAAKGLQ